MRLWFEHIKSVDAIRVVATESKPSANHRGAMNARKEFYELSLACQLTNENIAQRALVISLDDELHRIINLDQKDPSPLQDRRINLYQIIQPGRYPRTLVTS